MMVEETDLSTQSAPNSVRITHADITMDVDFETTTIQSTVTWTYRKLDPAATALLLDTKGIIIKSVRASRSHFDFFN